MKKVPTRRPPAHLPPRFDAVLASVGDGVITHDEHGVILAFEGAAPSLFGYAADEVIGTHVHVLMPAGLHSAHEREMHRFLSGGEPQMIGKGYVELPALHKDGTTFRVELAISPVGIGAQRTFVALVRDIGARKRAQAALWAKKERLRAARTSIGDAVITIDGQGLVTSINAVAEAMFGCSGAASLGWPLTALLNSTDAARTDEFNPAVFLRQADGSNRARLTVQLVHSGETLTIDRSVTPIRGSDGRVLGAVLVFREVGDARHLASMSAQHAARDALTGMVNRLEFERRLSSALLSSKAEPRDCSVLFLDLDQFNTVNEEGGTEAGDELLRRLAKMLRAKIRTGDTLARLGGDEFAVLLDSCPAEPALRIARMLRHAVRAFKFVWQEKMFSVTASVGVFTFCNEDLSAGDVLRSADAACYEAKAMGGNQVHVYAASPVSAQPSSQ
jgi:diguanylate cyclase (GGDEF)-like protein/PAS domain S-box-containing protein